MDYQQNLPWLGLWSKCGNAISRYACLRREVSLHSFTNVLVLRRLCSTLINLARVSPTGSLRKTEQPLGHQVTPPRVEIRDLAEYDQLFSLEATR